MYSRKLLTLFALLFSASSMISSPMMADKMADEMEGLPDDNLTISIETKEKALVQIAILLDTSGSMKGLIDQARAQLWNAVTELAKASREGQRSKLEIAVYQYGAYKAKGNIRQVTGFTDNMDKVSHALFSLTAGGCKEYCGEVINQAVTNLNWDANKDNYKVIFIAGNEAFDQGKVTFGQSYGKLLSEGIVINSIYCKSHELFKDREKWQAAAQLVSGMYFEIDHNHHLPAMKTPYDAKMRELNKRMNETFVWYGDGGSIASENQLKQDQNAAKMSDHAFAARMSTKVGHLYHHVHHDLIDSLLHGTVDLDKMPIDQMPELLQKMTSEARKIYLKDKMTERQRVRRLMAEVISKRHTYVQQMMIEKAGKNGKMPKVLGDALVQAVRKQATERNFEFADSPDKSL